MTRMFSRRSRQVSYAALAAALFLAAATPADANLPATFTDFGVVNYSGEHFYAYGSIQDEMPTQCLVVFSGLLWGKSRVPDQSGYFEIEFILEEGRSGMVQALLYDPYWQFTDFVEYYVENY